jgi:predicted permease
VNYTEQLVTIAYRVIGPIVVLTGAGYLIGRRVPATAEVLAKILLYLLIPVFVFLNILNSSLEGAACGTIILFSSLVLLVLWGAAWGVSRLRGHDPALRGAFANTAILYNSANFAIPVMALAFSLNPADQTYAVAVQVIVAACQGLAAYTIGAYVAAAGSGPIGRATRRIVGLPYIYALLAAMALKWLGVDARTVEAAHPFWQAVAHIFSESTRYISQAYVPMALMTLGAQMACVRLVRAPLDLALSMALRLIVGPLLALGLVKIMGLEGMLAQVLIIGAAGPSAVASAVVAIEFKNRPDFAASAVLLSTLGAGVTVPVVILLVQQFIAAP